MTRTLIIALFTGSAMLLVGEQLVLRTASDDTAVDASGDAHGTGDGSVIGVSGDGGGSNTPAGLLAATRPEPAKPGQTVLTRGSTGGFHLTAGINGKPANFVVDTGADLVSLSEDDARRLGLPVNPAAYRPMLQTADGLAKAQPLRIPRLTIGGQDMRDVPAVVVPGLEVNLLGESALRRLHRVVLSGDTMVIDPL